MNRECFQCGQQIDLPGNKVGFRAVCDFCSAWLHCCKACTHYCPGKPNDCSVPDTELVADREAANLCEDFQWGPKGPKGSKSSSAADVAKKLFGEDQDCTPKKFEDLW